VESVLQVQNAIRVMREHHGPTFVFLNFPKYGQSVLQPPNQPTRVSIAVADIINESVPAHLLLNQLAVITSTGVPVVHDAILRAAIPIRASHDMDDSLTKLGQLDIFTLQTRLEILVDHRVVPIQEWIRQVLQNYVLYNLQDVSGDFRDSLVAMDRLFALAIRYRTGLDLLFPLITTQSGLTNTPTIHENIFFNSNYIRSGFYDIFHDGMLESLFRNNGNRLIEAIFTASLEEAQP
jgi:hypothetical protein